MEDAVRDRRSNSPARDSVELTNAEIANLLLRLAQFLAASGENPYKVKAYRRAATSISNMGESVSVLVHEGADLTQYPGIGTAIRDAIHEIVATGTLRHLEKLSANSTPEMLGLSQHPLLDPQRVLRIYKKLGITTTNELQDRLAQGEIGKKFGRRMEQHIRRGLEETREFLWYHAEKIASNVEDYLLHRCKVRRAEPTGAFRRRVEVVGELSFLIEVEDFPAVVEKLQRYGGRADLLESDRDSAAIRLSSGMLLRVSHSSPRKWGLKMVMSTGSEEHVRQLQLKTLGALELSKRALPTEESVYTALGLAYIPPELREGHDEISLAESNRVPQLVSVRDIRGELHAHSLSSDGTASIHDMAGAALDKGLRYIGISDHSQSLKIAGGVSERDLWEQIRYIDRLNGEAPGIQILKSAEVDILQDGALDYSDALLKELDYTICSIHSRFGMNRTEQTERVLRAMDNRYFNILGHATGRLLLKRPGYEIDFERIIDHARSTNCHFELNSSPDRLDVSSANARMIAAAGVGIAITTDAHSTWDFNYLRYGVDQARRAGLSKGQILNHLDWPDLRRALQR